MHTAITTWRYTAVCFLLIHPFRMAKCLLELYWRLVTCAPHLHYLFYVSHSFRSRHLCVSFCIASVSERAAHSSECSATSRMYVFMALDNQTRIHSMYIGCVAPHVQNLDSFTQKTLFVRCVCVFFLYLFFQFFLVPWHFECMYTHWNRDKHTHTYDDKRENFKEKNP